jgi:hypothetical protein
MTRSVIVFATLALTATLAEAGVAPPVPRLPAAVVERLAGEQPGADSPEKIAERIQQNTRDAADRLAGEDPGEETRRKQEQALKDLDELLKQAQNQSPMGGQSGSENQQQGGQSSQGGQPMGGGAKGGGQQAGGGAGQQQQRQGGSWRDRRGQGQDQGGNAQRPQPGGQDQQPGGQDRQQAAGAGQQPQNVGGQQAGGGNRAAPELPLDDAITKQVWGHLPERLRQQMSQYYKEQFMPKYSEMLRQYYASLAEREKAQKK